MPKIKTKPVKVDISIHEVASIGPCVRVRDIKDDKKRDKFQKFMGGQTRPLVEGVPFDQQDFCYLCDYIHFLEIERAKGPKKKYLEMAYFD